MYFLQDERANWWWNWGLNLQLRGVPLQIRPGACQSIAPETVWLNQCHHRQYPFPVNLNQFWSDGERPESCGLIFCSSWGTQKPSLHVHRHKFYSTSYCIPSWNLVSSLFLLCKGKGRNIFTLTLSTKHQATSLDIRCLFSLLFK